MKLEQLLFSESHEWVAVTEEDGGKLATIGITAFAIEQLTDLVYMELPEVGRQVSTGEEFGEVESVKAVSPLYSPVDGEVAAVNTELPDRLDSLGEDPYDQGWIVKIKLANEDCLAKLMDFAAYEKQCAEEG